MELVKSRNIHIDAKLFQDKPPLAHVKILFPANEFSKTDDNEFHRLTLITFNARRNFYAVNVTNNRFFVADAGGNTIAALRIETGDHTHTTIRAAIKATIESAFTGTAAVGYNEIKKHLTIVMTPEPASGGKLQWVPENYFYSLATNNMRTHIILGGIPSVNAASIVPLFTDGGVNTYVSQLALTLFSDAELFLRCSLETNNFSTHTKDGLPNNGKLVNTQLFGRIPLNDANAEQVNQITWISYDDDNDNYQLYSQTAALGNIVFNVVDSFGRDMYELHENPTEWSNLDFDCILRWDLMRKTQYIETTLGCFNDKVNGGVMLDSRQDIRFERQ